MRKLIIVLTSLLILASCCPKPPIIEPDEWCSGGVYVVYFQDYRESTWMQIPPLVKKGTYWVVNDTCYYLGEPVENPVENYGICPDRVD